MWACIGQPPSDHLSDSYLLLTETLTVDHTEHKGLGTTVIGQHTERFQFALLSRFILPVLFRLSLFFFVPLILDLLPVPLLVVFCLVQAVVQTQRVVGVEHHTAIFVIAC